MALAQYGLSLLMPRFCSYVNTKALSVEFFLARVLAQTYSTAQATNIMEVVEVSKNIIL